MWYHELFWRIGYAKLKVGWTAWHRFFYLAVHVWPEHHFHCSDLALYNFRMSHMDPFQHFSSGSGRNDYSPPFKHKPVDYRELFSVVPIRKELFEKLPSVILPSDLTILISCCNVGSSLVLDLSSKISLWTAMLWKSHENVIKNPGNHFSGPWIQIFPFYGLFFRPWIFCEKLIMVFMAHEIAMKYLALGFMKNERW